MAEPIKNPIFTYFASITVGAFTVLMNIVYFGFLGPFLISFDDSFVVMMGFALAILDVILTVSLGILAYNSYAKVSKAANETVAPKLGR